VEVVRSLPEPSGEGIKLRWVSVGQCRRPAAKAAEAARVGQKRGTTGVWRCSRSRESQLRYRDLDVAR
jgi:hypothetical protein